MLDEELYSYFDTNYAVYCLKFIHINLNITLIYIVYYVYIK